MPLVTQSQMLFQSEVLSPDTERTDLREKWFAYALIPALKVYVIVAQDKYEVTVLRRGKPEPWIGEILSGREAVLRLPEIRVEIPLAGLYERISIARKKS